MIDILNKLNPENYSDKYETIYAYNNIPVPRVTNILSAMLHEEGLMGWSNYLGKKGSDYKKTLKLAADKGTYVHNAIEDYIQNNNELDYSKVDEMCYDDVYNAYNSFLVWWNNIKDNVEVLMEETPLIGKYFAGTLDLLIKYNEKIFLLDFKTSNHPSYKYFLQLSAYRYLLKELHSIDINGCGIIMLNKKSITFNEIIIDFENPYDLSFIDNCQETFFSLVYSFYQRLNVESMFKEILKRNEETVE